MTRRTLSLSLLAFSATIAGAHVASDVRAAELAHYSFDNTFNDSSSSMNHLSVASGTPGYTSTAGEFAFGSAGLDTNGNQEWLAINSPITFSAADSWTIAF